MQPIQRILVPCDGTTATTQAIAMALRIARDRGAAVRAMHVVDGLAHATGFRYSHELLQEMRLAGEKILRDAALQCEAAGVRHDTHLLERNGLLLGEAVADEALAWRADLVVVGSHRRQGLARFLLGHSADQILRLSPAPVLVVRDDVTAPPRGAGLDTAPPDAA